MRILPILVLCAVALSGCAADPSVPPDGRALLSVILPPSSVGRSIVSSQLMDIDVDGETQTFQIEVELTPAHLAMVGLTTYGAPVFTLVQRAGKIEVRTFGVNAFPVDPRYVLSDFQLSRWPSALLNDPLDSQGFVLREAAGTRTVFTGLGARLVEIISSETDYRTGVVTSGRIDIRRFDPRYRATMRSIGSGTGH